MAPISSYTEKQVRDLIKTSDSGMPYPTSTTQSTKNQTVDHTGPDIHYIRNHVYAYSGSHILSSGTFLKQLDFTTNSEYILSAFNWGTDETSSTRDVYIKIDFNGITVYSNRWAQSNQYPIQSSSLPLVIPPFTLVECYQKNDGTTSGVFNMTGEVYEP